MHRTKYLVQILNVNLSMSTPFQLDDLWLVLVRREAERKRQAEIERQMAVQREAKFRELEEKRRLEQHKLAAR